MISRQRLPPASPWFFGRPPLRTPLDLDLAACCEEASPAVALVLDLGGTYGDPEAGAPIQYDELRIEHDQGDAEIVVYDRAILLFRTDIEAVRRIHQVCCRLDDIAARRG